jgi:glycosyltransferase involved in cell wall biosynthesis
MNTHIKVVLLSPLPPPQGGIATWTKHILNYYQEVKDLSDISLIHVSTSKTIGRITDKRLLYRLWTGIVNTYSIIKEVRNTIDQTKPNVVHFTSSASLALFKDYIIQTIIRLNNADNIIHFRFGRIPQLSIKKNWEWMLLTLIIKRSSRCIVIDQKSYNTLIAFGFTNVDYVPNPVSPELLKLIEENNAKHIVREKRKIIFVGHVILTKGVYELVKACLDIPNITLELIGPYEEKVKRELFSLAKNRNNGDWMTMAGSLKMNQIIQKMMMANVFCLPSYSEGFPNVILESMACGCPIISTTVGAIPEMLNILDIENKCGICVNPNDICALKHAIGLYLNDEKLAKQHGDAARKRVVSEYNMPIVWGMLTKVWEKVN